MVPGRVDPTVHEFLPRDRGERLGGGIVTAAAGPPDGREDPAAGHESRASGRRASSPPTRVEDPDTTGRWTGPARPRPRPRRRARRARDRRSRARRPLPREAIHDDRRVGGSPPGRHHARCRPPASSRARRQRSPGQPARPARKIRRRHDPSRPVPEGPTGNRTRRHHDPADHAERGLDPAPGRPRADPTATADPFRPVKEPDNDDRQVLPPPGRRGPGTAPPGAAAGPGCLHPPAHGPDGAVASSAADAAASHAHPDPRAKKTTAPFREPVPHAGPPEPRPQPPDPGAPLHGHGISAETGALPPPSRDPAPDRPHHKTTRSGHPGHRPGTPDDPENDPPPEPRTASRHRHDPTPPHDHSTHRPKNTKHSTVRVRTRNNLHSSTVVDD